MKIPLKKYGQILTSRPAGREAALAMRTAVKPADGETIELDFEGVLSVGPSWLDEVLTFSSRRIWQETGHLSADQEFLRHRIIESSRPLNKAK